MNSTSSLRLAANLACLATASVVHGQTRIVYVDDSAAPGGNGQSWNTAFKDLSQALNQSGVLDQIEIHVAQGVYTPDSGTLSRSRSFTIHSNNTASAMVLSVPGGFSVLGGFRGVSGGGSPDERDPSRFVTVLSGDLYGDDGANFANRGDNSEQILDIISRDPVTIDGVTIRGGETMTGIGTITTGTVTSNFARQPTPMITFSRCRVVDNTGGIAVVYAGIHWQGIPVNVEIADCEFSHNRFSQDSPYSDYGVVVIANDTTGNVRRTRFVDNHCVSGVPGLVHYSTMSMQVEDCVFAGNTTQWGGTSALQITPWGNLISRCTFVANRTLASQFGVAVDTGGNYFCDCIFVPYPGWNVKSQIGAWSGGDKARFDHCAIAGGFSSIQGNASSLLNLGGIISTDPRFVDLDGFDNSIDTWDDNDLRLAWDSPCIDAGRRIAARDRAIDIDGLARFADGNGDGVAWIDMGAHEFNVPTCTADIDGSGFVDTEDFDAFVRAFESGC